jgi:hypothetical protein
MIKNISKSRREYEKEYRYLRLNAGVTQHREPIWPTSEAEDCAILSYDFHDSDFSGWINRQRQHKFHMIKWHPELRNELPF